MKTNRWIDITDSLGRDLLGRAGELAARFVILNLAEEIYDGPGRTVDNSAVSMLMHAGDYLKDRVGYEMEPHPKGMIRMPGEVKA